MIEIERININGLDLSLMKHSSEYTGIVQYQVSKDKVPGEYNLLIDEDHNMVLTDKDLNYVMTYLNTRKLNFTEG